MSELFSIQLQNRQQGRDGVWLDLPTTTEQVQAALRQIGISSDNPQMCIRDRLHGCRGQGRKNTGTHRGHQGRA